MASSSGLDLKAARHLSAALQITFDRAQAVGSLRLFRPHHFQQLSKQRQGIGLTIQLSCPLKPFLHPGSWRIGSYSSHPSRLHPKLFVSAFVGYIRLIIPRNKQSYTPDLPFHTTSSTRLDPPRAHELRFFDVRGPEYGHT